MSNLNLEDSRKIIAAAEEEARRIGVAMNIAITDSAGHLVAHVRMDGARVGSIDVSIKKAFTAAAFQTPTDVLGAMCQPGHPTYGLQFSNEGRVMIFGGGFPLKRKGELLGAIGVSGGTIDEDIAVAEAGIAAF